MTDSERKKQEMYRDARFTEKYDDIWQSVGKCVFCDLRDKYVLHEENGIVLTITLFAYIDGHMMIVPRRHVRSPKDLTELEWATIRKFTYLAKKLIREVHHVRGMQLVYKDGAEAQSTVSDHLHFHVIPFDAADLSTWNYRRLKYTPLENIDLYRQANKKLVRYGQRFHQKYRAESKLAISSDLILVNTRDEVLFLERPAWARIGDDWMTMPGGRVEDFERTLQEELAREVKEETGLIVDHTKFTLVDSRVADLKRAVPNNPDSDYTDRFLWNTYLLTGHDPDTPIHAADDAETAIWVPINKIAQHTKISPGVKAAITKALS